MKKNIDVITTPGGNVTSVGWTALVSAKIEPMDIQFLLAMPMRFKGKAQARKYARALTAFGIKVKRQGTMVTLPGDRQGDFVATIKFYRDDPKTIAFQKFLRMNRRS